MHVDEVYQSGNTIRLTCELCDFDGKITDPQIIKIKLYDQKFNVIKEIEDIQRIDIGKFYYDFITDNNNSNKRYYYEWYAEIDGTPSLKRSSFMTRFI